MADLDLRFDEYTEKYSDKMLGEVREYAANHTLPPKVVVEVGSNRGKFLWQLALRQDDKFHIGMEIKRKLVRTAQRRLEREGVENAQFLCADANLAIPILIDDGQLTDFFLLYPDPWWKKKHAKRRVIQPKFLDLLAQKMPKGGNIWIRTDVGPLADEMRDTLVEHPEFEPLPFDEFPRDPWPWTTREYHCFEAGLPSHLVYFRRK